MTDIKKQSRNYIKQELYLVVALFLVVLLIMRIRYMDELLTPSVIGAFFTLITSCATAIVWRRIATKHPSDLPTFYTAVSGFRLLLALATMFVYYLIAGRQAMMVFFLVFMAYYIASLIHHSVFFARVSNRS